MILMIKRCCKYTKNYRNLEEMHIFFILLQEIA